MKKIMLPLAIGLIAAAMPAMADPGNGKDKGKFNGPAAATLKHGNEGHGNDKNAAKSSSVQKMMKNGTDSKKNIAARRFDEDDDKDYRRSGWKQPEKRDYRDDPFEIGDIGRRFGFYDDDGNRGVINGCPPGLAKKNNGCTPPGLAKKNDYDNGWWNRIGRWNDDNLFYRNGYLMGLDSNGTVSRYLPLLGGALQVGSPFPDNYRSYPVSDYRARFYGGDDDYIYRYSDGVIYALEPESYAIAEVAGLLTGDDFTIGEPVPAGYSVYNVPYGYRDRYVDGPDGYYRYNDGYVYRVDPETQLVKAAIQLLS